MDKNNRIFFTLEKVNLSETKLEHDFEKDEEKYFYIAGIASTEDENCVGFVVENSALLDCWKKVKAEGKNIAVYEKHDYPVGKVVSCEEMNGKVLVVMEIPKAGNERVIAIYEQGVYVGLSIGGWELNGTWVKEVYHVTEFEWYEVSLTDIPANENALLLEQAKAQKPVEEEPIEEEEPIVEEEPIEKPEVQLEKEITKEDLITLSKSIIDNIRGIN